MSAVLFAGLAAGRLRLELGRTLAEGRSLTLAGAERLVELPGQVGDLRAEFVQFLSEGHAAGTDGFVHDPMLTTQRGFSCASLRRR